MKELCNKTTKELEKKIQAKELRRKQLIEE